jgi:pimeloyl-ACP methyl ester carboxylesterase
MSERMPLVLLPAFMTTGNLWRHQIEALADIADIQVGDLTGHDSIAGMAASVLERMPARCALAGLSLGGYTAFEIMRQAPERVTRLALVSTTARADTPERIVARKAQVEMVRAGRFDEAVAQFLALIQNPDNPLDASLRESVRAMCREVGPDGLLRQQTAMMNRIDRRDGLSAISCPTVVICGRQDQPAPPEHSKEIATGIPGAKLIVVENCGHLSALERPTEVNAALRAWLLS